MPAGQPFVDALGKKGYVVLALVVTAIGGSLIKPCIVGTVARTTTEETKSLGYSIYYSLVNFGGFFGPILASEVRTRWGIAEVLLMSAAVSAALVLGTLVFYREPAGPREGRTFAKVFSDAAHGPPERALHAFLVIFSGFWIMFWQVFYALPFYVTDILKIERFELLETVDALGIIFLSVPATALMKKVRPIRAMAGGFAVASASWLVITFTQSWQGVVVAMLLFALGESMQAPRFYEYVADLAPKEQTGTYMGFAFLPVAIGAFVAGPPLGLPHRALPQGRRTRAGCGSSSPRSASGRRPRCSSTTASSRRRGPPPDGGGPACSRFSRSSPRSPPSGSRRGCASGSCGWRRKSARCARREREKEKDFLRR